VATRNTDRKVGQPGKWTVFLVGLGAAATVVAAPGDKAPDSALVTVTNDATQPIPVAGEVAASVSGTVEVSSVPATLTDRVDLVLQPPRGHRRGRGRVSPVAMVALQREITSLAKVSR